MGKNAMIANKDFSRLSFRRPHCHPQLHERIEHCYICKKNAQIVFAPNIYMNINIK